MTSRRADWLVDSAVIAAALVLPFVGMLIGGRDVSALFDFPPPLEIPHDYLRFSWVAVGAVAAALIAFGGGWIAGARRREKNTPKPPTNTLSDTNDTPPPVGAFPGWGWLAIAWTLVWWLLAWTRFPWFATMQRFTFFPLWLGFIVTVNALAEARTGTCLMRRAPMRWLTLFGASALFWWGFEWLNRFVRNWHYLGVEDFSAAAYALHASICFSTVLPAIAAVAEYLVTRQTWREKVETGPPWTWLTHRGATLGLVATGGIALVLTGLFPEWLYPAVWLAPLALSMGAAQLRRRDGVTSEIARGDWLRAASWMIAALVCGAFWELWNWRSAAKWIYTVPGVERWHVFEMPLLGYAGYLPFGLLCLFVVERLPGKCQPLLNPLHVSHCTKKSHID